MLVLKMICDKCFWLKCQDDGNKRLSPLTAYEEGISYFGSITCWLGKKSINELLSFQ